MPLTRTQRRNIRKVRASAFSPERRRELIANIRARRLGELAWSVDPEQLTEYEALQVFDELGGVDGLAALACECAACALDGGLGDLGEDELGFLKSISKAVSSFAKKAGDTLKPVAAPLAGAAAGAIPVVGPFVSSYAQNLTSQLVNPKDSKSAPPTAPGMIGPPSIMTTYPKNLDITGFIQQTQALVAETLSKSIKAQEKQAKKLKDVAKQLQKQQSKAKKAKATNQTTIIAAAAAIGGLVLLTSQRRPRR